MRNGKYFLATNATYYGAALHYECDEHYELDGHARRLCLENGTWSSEAPVCKGKSHKIALLDGVDGVIVTLVEYGFYFCRFFDQKYNAKNQKERKE